MIFKAVLLALSLIATTRASRIDYDDMLDSDPFAFEVVEVVRDILATNPKASRAEIIKASLKNDKGLFVPLMIGIGKAQQDPSMNNTVADLLQDVEVSQLLDGLLKELGTDGGNYVQGFKKMLQKPNVIPTPTSQSQPPGPSLVAIEAASESPFGYGDVNIPVRAYSSASGVHPPVNAVTPPEKTPAVVSPNAKPTPEAGKVEAEAEGDGKILGMSTPIFITVTVLTTVAVAAGVGGVLYYNGFFS